MDQTVNAVKIMDLQFVLVYLVTLAHHHLVDLNVLLIRIVDSVKLVRIRNVEIRVLAHVALVLNVRLSITIQFAHVYLDILAMPFQDVSQFVSIPEFCFYFANQEYDFENSTFLFFSAPPPVIHDENPCVPSPCGPNAICQVKGETPSCSCLPNFIDHPPNCRPECVSNSECPNYLACLNQKCKDPCPGVCAPNAECHVISHTPICSCTPGYTGNPMAQCNVLEGINFSNFSILL